ncbi:hypothetical protein [Mycolicibacterium sp. J2]|uniref:hypothetical protein n=1 Tax=Mycolicibacterium sp. J2 TaxID=2993511 RepID=UPI00224A6D83|nr:hypothetical protein [Mycolicibacterium sp. J2]MCX2712879.1 hypothetical protein [Mycolicibacterium sp. J2]
MDLNWWVVAIAGCVALAAVIAAAALWPTDTGRSRLRPLANTARLTRLPEYRRAVRLRTLWLAVTALLLVTGFAAATLAAARPSGLPSAANGNLARPAEDIMVCTGAPASDPAVAAVLRYFAERTPGFGAQRIGLTSANRRVIPLTRDYQYAAAHFGAAARSGAGLVANVSYTDYAADVDDVLAMCLTGFPDFGEPAANPRSLIYVGPGALRRPGDPRGRLFSADRVRELADTAAVQVNAVVVGGDDGTLDRLVQATGGVAVPADGSTAARIAEIMARPPAVVSAATGEVTTRTVESPDIPLVVALLAVTALLIWPRLVRR